MWHAHDGMSRSIVFSIALWIMFWVFPLFAARRYAPREITRNEYDEIRAHLERTPGLRTAADGEGAGSAQPPGQTASGCRLRRFMGHAGSTVSPFWYAPGRDLARAANQAASPTIPFPRPPNGPAGPSLT